MNFSYPSNVFNKKKPKKIHDPCRFPPYLHCIATYDLILPAPIEFPDLYLQPHSLAAENPSTVTPRKKTGTYFIALGDFTQTHTSRILHILHVAFLRSSPDQGSPHSPTEAHA